MPVQGNALNGISEAQEVARQIAESLKHGGTIALPPGRVERAAITMEEARGIAARGYCHPENENKVLDPDLCEAIAREIVKATGTEVANFGPSPLAAAWRPWKALQGRDGQEAVVMPHMDHHIAREIAESIKNNPVVALPAARLTAEQEADLRATFLVEVNETPIAGPRATAYTNTGTTGATWNSPPGDILASVKATIDKLKAETGYDRGPDVLVMLLSDAEKVHAQCLSTFGVTATTYGFPNAIGGIRIEVVMSVDEGRALALDLQAKGKRVGLVGKLNVGPSEPAADVPLEAKANG